MFIGAISFFGRLSRVGWAVTTVLSLVAAGVALGMAVVLINGQPRPALVVQERIVYVAWGFVAVAVLTVLGASVRRLRDAGSGLPFLEMLLGAVIPMFGWVWLLYRLPFAPSAAQKQVVMQTAAPREPAGQRRVVGELLAVIPDAGRRRMQNVKPPELVQGRTVRRVRRVSETRARRRIGF